MASEYLEWLARNEKPAEKRELTKKEKNRNWWFYHKWHVVIGIALAVLAITLVTDVVSGMLEKPDYRVAYFGTRALPDDTVVALKENLAAYGEDLSGDGKVSVELIQYLNQDDYYEKTRIMADLGAGESFLFLVEDPEAVQKTYGVFSYSDGSYPEDGQPSEEKQWFLWRDCPRLAALPLGAYLQQVTTPDAEVIYEEAGDSQELLSGLYVARRGFGPGTKEKLTSAYDRFWDALMEGAEE